MKLSWHKLRHSFAHVTEERCRYTRCEGTKGHSSIETTMINTHVNDEQKKRAMATVNVHLNAIGETPLMLARHK